MSASREKKQRQGVGPTEQEILAREKAAAYKKKARTYTIIGVVIAVLVAALLIWDSGLFQRGQTAAVVGDTNYSVSDASYFYQQVRANNFMYYYYLGMDVPADDEVMDAESGQTYREYFLEQALLSMTEITALYDEALANGWTEQDVAGTVQEEIDNMKAAASSYGYSYAAYLKAQYGDHMTKSAFKSVYTKVALADAYATDYSENIEIADEEIQAYYEENKDTLDSYTYSTLFFAPEEVATTDEEGNDLGLTEEKIAILEEAAMEEALANADAALADLQDGATLEEVAQEHGLEESDIVSSATSLGSSLSSYYSEEMAAMAEGDMAVVEYGTSGYYVVILHERKLVEDVTADVRHILISAETTTDESGSIVAPTDEAWAAAKAEAEKVLAEYQSGEQTAEAFGALAEAHSTDTGSNTNGGLYEGVAQGSFVAEFDSWLFDSPRAPGDVDLIQHVAGEDDSNVYYGYHIVYYVGEGDPVWMGTADNALRSEKSTAWLESLTGQYTAELASGSRYVAN